MVAKRIRTASEYSVIHPLVGRGRRTLLAPKNAVSLLLLLLLLLVPLVPADCDITWQRGALPDEQRLVPYTVPSNGTLYSRIQHQCAPAHRSTCGKCGLLNNVN
jgi:hypothetical protein